MLSTETTQMNTISFQDIDESEREPRRVINDINDINQFINRCKWAFFSSF